MIAFGLMMGLVALKPYRYSRFMWVAVALIAIRIFDRIFFFDTLKQTFNTTSTGNLWTIIPIVLFALGLIIFRPKTELQSS